MGKQGRGGRAAGWRRVGGQAGPEAPERLRLEGAGGAEAEGRWWGVGPPGEHQRPRAGERRTDRFTPRRSRSERFPGHYEASESSQPRPRSRPGLHGPPQSWPQSGELGPLAEPQRLALQGALRPMPAAARSLVHLGNPRAPSGEQ